MGIYSRQKFLATKINTLYGKNFIVTLKYLSRYSNITIVFHQTNPVYCFEKLLYSYVGRQRKVCVTHVYPV